MKLLDIGIRNFRLHAETDITFPEEGIVGIVGTNESGKSTILEAAVWALYGGDTTRGTKSGLRWHGAPTRRTASVTLRFEVGGKVYRVERGESSASLHDEALGIPLVDGVAAVNGYTPQLLGMTHAEFAASFMVKQKDVDRIATMLPTERVAFIRHVMGMGRIDAALKACRTRKSALSQELDGLIRGLGERLPLEEAIDDAAAAVLSAEARLREAQRVEKAAVTAHEAAQAAAQESTNRKSRHDAHRNALKQAGTAREAAALEVDRLKTKLAKVDGARERIELLAPKLAGLPALRKERDDLVAARSAVGERNAVQERIAGLARDIAEDEEVIADAERQIERAEAEDHQKAAADLKAASAKLAHLTAARTNAHAKLTAEAAAHEKEATRNVRRLEAIRDAGEDGDCPTCARRLGEAYQEVVLLLAKAAETERDLAASRRTDASELADPSDDEMAAAVEVDAAQAEVERLNVLRQDRAHAIKVIGKRRPELAAARINLKKAQDRLAGLPSVAFDAARLKAVEEDIEHRETLDTLAEPDRALVAQEEEARELLVERQKMLDAALQAYADAAQGLEETPFDDDEHEDVVNAEAAGRKAAEDARVATARADEAVKGAIAQVETARNALGDYDQRAVRLNEVTALHLTHERTAARLADFRTAVAATIRPEMEELMSGFVHLLTDGRHEAVTLSEDFAATLHESGVPVEVVSGGTEDIAALAMRLALSQMIAERAGHPLSLLVLDEPFGSLDETRRGNVLTLIRRLRGVFSQVVVISHIAETRDAVDHVVELDFDERAGRSRVVSSPPALAPDAPVEAA